MDILLRQIFEGQDIQHLSRIFSRFSLSIQPTTLYPCLIHRYSWNQTHLKLQQLRQFSTNFPSWIWSWASCLLLGFYKIQLPASVYSILQLKSQPISSVLWVTFLYFFSPLHVVSSWFLFQGWIAWLWFDLVWPLVLCFHFAMMYDSCFWLLLDCNLPLLPCVCNA